MGRRKSRKKGVGYGMGRRLCGKGRRLQGSCWHLRESCLTLGWLCYPRRTKPGLSSSCGWGRQVPDQGAVFYHVAGELTSAPLTGIPQSFFSQWFLPVTPLVSKAPAWAPRQRGEFGRGYGAEVKGLVPGPVIKDWKSCCHWL